MEIKYWILLLVFSLGVKVLHYKNKIKSEKIRERMKKRLSDKD